MSARSYLTIRRSFGGRDGPSSVAVELIPPLPERLAELLEDAHKRGAVVRLWDPELRRPVRVVRVGPQSVQLLPGTLTGQGEPYTVPLETVAGWALEVSHPAP